MFIDPLFFSCWRNVYIKSIIFYYLKTNKTSISNVMLEKYNYYQLNDVNLMVSNKKLLPLLVDKIKKRCELNFNFTKNEIPFQIIFQHLNSSDYREFYQSLFKNYSWYFLSSVDLIVDYAISCNNKIIIQVLLEKFSLKLENYNKLFIEAILIGSIEIADFLKNKYLINLSGEEFKKIWDLILGENIETFPKNEAYSTFNGIKHGNEMGSDKKNESIQYLVKELNAPIPPLVDSNSFKCFIDFSIKNRNLKFILSTCYSISYLKSSLESFKSISPSYTDSIKILSIQELDEIRDRLTLQELESNVQDIETNNQIISQLVGMASKYTNINFNVNMMFYYQHYYPNDLKQWCDVIYNVYNYNEVLISHGDYKNLVLNVNKLPIEPSVEGKSIYSMGIESFTLFRSCKKDLQDKCLTFIQDAINHQLDQSILPEMKHSICDVIKFFISFGNLQMIQQLLSQLDQNNIQVHHSNSMYSLISNTEMFDIIYQRFRDTYNLNEFLDNVNMFNKNEIKYLMLNHFKKNYTQDYYEQVANYSPIVSHLLNEFIFDNIDDFKGKIIESKIWLKRTEFINTFVPLKHFIKLIEIIPTEEIYNCLDSVEILKYIFDNRKQDVINGRFDIQENSSIFNLYASGMMEEIFENHLEKPINLQTPNLNRTFNLIIKSIDLKSMKFLIDYFNLSSNKNFILDFKGCLIAISNNNRLEVLSFLYNNYPTLLSQNNLQYLFEHCIQVSGSIEIIHYIIKKIRFKPNFEFSDKKNNNNIYNKTLIAKNYFLNLK
ncbi:hypothetical protein RB653_006270 [Dictyostelium firmibasis]|uniref:Uncharacterized protein n=1 Tax=Dictyostelium firmibasis TaxID=79012 RepID=A0AAN7UE65_9MYCE